LRQRRERQRDALVVLGEMHAGADIDPLDLRSHPRSRAMIDGRPDAVEFRKPTQYPITLELAT
jgi:hypothetical protein